MGRAEMQEKLNLILRRSTKWQLSISPAHCSVVDFSKLNADNETTFKSVNPITSNSNDMVVWSIVVDNRMTLSNHISRIVKKAY